MPRDRRTLKQTASAIAGRKRARRFLERWGEPALAYARAVEPTAYPEVSEFTSGRMRLLAPCLTPLAIELGRRRIFEPGFRIINRVKDSTGKERIVRTEGTPADLKGALIVAKMLNPVEVFTGEEDALYYGANRKTISGMRARGELVG